MTIVDCFIWTSEIICELKTLLADTLHQNRRETIFYIFSSGPWSVLSEVLRMKNDYWMEEVTSTRVILTKRKRMMEFLAVVFLQLVKKINFKYVETFIWPSSKVFCVPKTTGHWWKV